MGCVTRGGYLPSLGLNRLICKDGSAWLDRLPPTACLAQGTWTSSQEDTPAPSSAFPGFSQPTDTEHGISPPHRTQCPHL